MMFAWRPLLGATVALAFIAACVASLSGDWASFFSVESGARMLEFVQGFYPPALGAEFLSKVAVASFETLAISWIGTLIAAVIGLGLAAIGAAATRAT